MLYPGLLPTQVPTRSAESEQPKSTKTPQKKTPQKKATKPSGAAPQERAARPDWDQAGSGEVTLCLFHVPYDTQPGELLHELFDKTGLKQDGVFPDFFYMPTLDDHPTEDGR